MALWFFVLEMLNLNTIMLRKFIRYLLLMAFCCATPLLYTDAICHKQRCVALQTCDAETLSQRLFAVHATRILPQEGVLKAALGYLSSYIDDYPIELFPDFRCTVHFSLGELVRPRENMITWEDCPFAIVTPLESILPQTINVNCYDTFILGDYILDERATLVLPVEYRDRFPSKPVYRLYYYDQECCSLRQAVDAVIAEQGGWPIRMTNEDKYTTLMGAWFDGVDINTFSFFSPLHQAYPHLSIGCRSHHLHGDAYRFGELETLIYTIVWHYLPWVKDGLGGHIDDAPLSFKMMNTEALIETRNTLMEKAIYLEGFVAGLPVPESASAPFKSNYRRLLSWITIIDADIKLRTVHGKTLTQPPRAYWIEIDRFRFAPEELEAYLEGLVDTLRDYSLE